MTNQLENSTILVTGGTGSFGHKFIPMTLERYNPKKIIVFFRDEMNQWEMANLFHGDDHQIILASILFLKGDLYWIDVQLTKKDVSSNPI